MDRICKQIDCNNPIYWKKAFCTLCLHKNVQYWPCEVCGSRLDSVSSSFLKKKCNECSRKMNVYRQRGIRRERTPEQKKRVHIMRIKLWKRKHRGTQLQYDQKWRSNNREQYNEMMRMRNRGNYIRKNQWS